MSEQETNPVKSLLLKDLNLLKTNVKEIRASHENELDAFKEETNVLIEHGKKNKELSELLNSLLGQTITEDHLSYVTKYTDYLRVKVTESKDIIKGLEAKSKSQEADQSIEDMLG